MSNGTFDFNLFVKESKDVLTDPKSYFSTMQTSGGMTEPLIKAVIYGVIAGVIALLWSLLNLSPVAGGMFGGAVGIMVFIWKIIGSIIGLFLGGVILLVLSSICKGNADYEANVRVTAALMVMMPISALLAFTGSLNLYLGVIVGLALNVYMIWMLYNGLVEALKANPGTTRIVAFVLIAIFVLFMLAGIGTKKAADRYMNSNFQEMIKDMDTN